MQSVRRNFLLRLVAGVMRVHRSRWWSFDDRKVERYDIKNLERDCFGGKHLIDSNDSFLKSSLSQV